MLHDRDRFLEDLLYGAEHDMKSCRKQVNSDQRYSGPIRFQSCTLVNWSSGYRPHLSVRSAIKHLLEGEAAGVAVRIGPMGRVQEMAKHVVFQALLRIGAGDLAELHLLPRAERCQLRPPIVTSPK